jgi:hypothetical protein
MKPTIILKNFPELEKTTFKKQIVEKINNPLFFIFNFFII